MSWFMILIFLPIWVMAQNDCFTSHRHTMRKFQGIGPTCGSDPDSGVSYAEIQQILKLHNDFRSKIALGREFRGSPGPQPQAANMHALVWDDNLAAVAQKWADQCIFQHDQCRNDPRFSVGQNIYFSTGFSKVNWTRPISAWYEEVTKFDFRFVNSYKFQLKTAHYTQLVWGNTRYIGCGRTSFGGYYRPRDYQKTEYILSSTPLNDSFMDYYDRRRTDILPDPEAISNEDETTTKSPTTNQTTEKIESLTSMNEETTLPTGTHAYKETKFDKPTAENSTNKSDRNVLENENIRPTQNTTKSHTDENGKVGEVFQSLKFSEPANVKQFFQKTPLNGATKIQSGNPTIGNWNFNYYNGPFNFEVKGSSQNRATPFEYEQSTLENFGRNQILVCNYGPSGNYLNEPVYIRGQSCSKCLFGSKCDNGLCS